MKKEYEFSLHSNKMLNVLKYIVLIFAFLMVGMFNSVRVQAVCNEYKGGSIKCDEEKSGVNAERVRILSEDAMNKDGRSEVEIKICEKNNTSKCTARKMLKSRTSDKPVGFDLEIFRTEGMYRGFNVEIGTILFEYKTTYSCGFLNWGTCYSWSGWSDKGNINDLLDGTELDLNSDLLLYVNVTSYTDMIYVGPGGTNFDELGIVNYVNIIVDRFYFSSNEITITEEIDGKEMKDEWSKTHNPIIKVDAKPDATKIYYCWFQEKQDIDSIPWPNCSQTIKQINVPGNNMLGIPSKVIPQKVVNPAVTESGKNSIQIIGPGNGSYTGNYYLYVRTEVTIFDDVVTKTAWQEFDYDNTPPTITYNYEKGKDLSKWHQSVKVDFTFSDDHSQINEGTRKYCISYSSSLCPFVGGKENWLTYSKEITVTLDQAIGNRYVHVRVQDNVGNEITYRGKEKLQIDTKGPELVGGELVEDKSWHKQEDYVKLQFEDERDVKLLNYVFYCWSKTEKGCFPVPSDDIHNLPEGVYYRQFESGGYAYIAYPNIEEGKAEEYYLSVIATDSLGNYNKECNKGKCVADPFSSKFSYKVDNANPVIRNHSCLDANGVACDDAKKYKNVKLSVIIEELGSGLSDDKITLELSPNINLKEDYLSLKKIKNSNEWELIITIDTDDELNNVPIYVYLTVSDNLDFRSSTIQVGFFNLDNVKVSGTIVAYSRKSDASEATASNVMLMVLESDEESEEKEVEVMELVELEEEHEEKEVVSLLVEEVKEEKDVGETVTYKPIVEDKIKVGVEIQYSTVIGGVYLFAKKRKRINVS